MPRAFVICYQSHAKFDATRVSISNLNQVICELFDYICSVAWLDRLWIVGDEQCLGCLNDDDALAALCDVSAVKLPLPNARIDTFLP